MKNVIFTAVIFLLFGTLKAQHTLQYNQALLLTNGVSYTVPANTVWKLEGATFTSSASVYNSTGLFYGNQASLPQLTIIPAGGSTTTALMMGVTGSYVNPISTSFPMWLPAGTTVQVPSTATTCISLVSVIEFIVD